jgi:hypothetical protein
MKTILWTLTVLVLISFFVGYVYPESSIKTWDGNYLAILEMSPEKRSESFSTLLTSAVPSRNEALSLTQKYWFRNHGLLAEESFAVTGLYRIGREIKGFAARGDWVWEVRVLHLNLSVDGVLWVNAQSKKVIVFGPRK